MRSLKWLVALAGSIALALFLGALLAGAAPASQAAPAPAATPAGVDPAQPGISRTVESALISFIDSPSPTCYRAAVGTGVCYIEWSYMSVTASASNYVVSMTVSIDNRVRGYSAGFFQTSMTIPGDMFAPGFQVTCGRPGSGSVAGMGKDYSYVIRARETGGLSSANYGTVTCPADVVKERFPLIRKRSRIF